MIPRRVPKTGEAKFVTFGNRLLPNQEILPEDLPQPEEYRVQALSGLVGPVEDPLATAWEP